MRRSVVSALLVSALLADPALAAPGAGDKVYGATVENGITEFEARYGRLVGDEAGGEDVLKLEVAHGFSDRLYGAVVAEIEREPSSSRKLEALSIEGIYALGKIGGIDAALYGGYEIGLHGADAVETKLLLQKRVGEFDARLNLIGEKHLDGTPVELGYAASADFEAIEEVRFGLAAFGELGTTKHVTTHAEHFVGPIAKFEIEHLGKDSELEVETGYLFAVGEARRETDGQFRLLFEYETRF